MFDTLRESGWLLLEGTMWTILLSLVTLLLGGVMGFLLALIRVYGVWPLRAVVDAYVYVIRGIPLLLLLFFMYYGLPYMGIDLPTLPGGIAVMSLYFTALMCEIWRGALQSLPRGQLEAARALGMRLPLALTIILVPQAVRAVAGPLVNMAVLIVKSTSLVSIIGLSELTMVGHEIIERTFKPFEILGAIAVIYFAICYGLSRLGKAIEEKVQYGNP